MAVEVLPAELEVLPPLAELAVLPPVPPVSGSSGWGFSEHAPAIAPMSQGSECRRMFRRQSSAKGLPLPATLPRPCEQRVGEVRAGSGSELVRHGM